MNTIRDLAGIPGYQGYVRALAYMTVAERLQLVTQEMENLRYLAAGDMGLLSILGLIACGFYDEARVALMERKK